MVQAVQELSSGMAAALSLARLTHVPSHLQDPAWLRQLMLGAIAPVKQTEAQLAAAGTITAADGRQLAIRAQPGGKQFSAPSLKLLYCCSTPNRSLRMLSLN